MTILAGSYVDLPGSLDTNPFGPVIPFDTPYVYNPGEELVMYLTHTGSNPSTEPPAFFPLTFFSIGSATGVSDTGTYLSNNASAFFDPFIVQFTTVPVPEPSSLILIGVGTLTFIRHQFRRRR